MHLPWDSQCENRPLATATNALSWSFSPAGAAGTSLTLGSSICWFGVSFSTVAQTRPNVEGKKALLESLNPSEEIKRHEIYSEPRMSKKSLTGDEDNYFSQLSQGNLYLGGHVRFRGLGRISKGEIIKFRRGISIAGATLNIHGCPTASYILRYYFPIFLPVPLTYMCNLPLSVPYFRSDTLADFTPPLLTLVQYRACSLIWHFQALSSSLPEMTKGYCRNSHRAETILQKPCMIPFRLALVHISSR